jgi:AcrR family transcriptional regulator
MTTTEPRRPRGRPRNPMVEPLMYEAAIAVYADRGWYGFSLEAVGRQAGVSQGAMYRRWSSKAELLAEAVNARAPVLPHIDTGSSREDLLALTQHFLLNFRDEIGVVGLRMVLDARTNPELAEQFALMLHGTRMADAQRIVRRAMARGDLRATSVGLVIEVVVGTTLSHVLFTPQPHVAPGEKTAADDRFMARLVDSLLVEQE